MSNSDNLAQSMPSSMQYQSYTPTFGNIGFQVEPSKSGEVSNTFGQIPYLSLESLIYMQQMNAQTSPTNVMAGQNTGQQNIQGSYTIQDSNGLPRMVMGFQAGGF